MVCAEEATPICYIVIRFKKYIIPYVSLECVNILLFNQDITVFGSRHNELNNVMAGLISSVTNNPYKSRVSKLWCESLSSLLGVGWVFLQRCEDSRTSRDKYVSYLILVRYFTKWMVRCRSGWPDVSCGVDESVSGRRHTHVVVAVIAMTFMLMRNQNWSSKYKE